ncbi:hypothetical protein Vretifemale_1808 [Volvox reticuliferus]|uniref:Uncharacterized protein n=1 Tax=Volvox reticuliferus TaxID=1737510 RepID=A0A8J4BYU4_9CHLO|nr:hypothetical protein Vretifemale_1808 [Volvox reticuliferus]
MVVLGLGGSRAATGLADLQLEEQLTWFLSLLTTCSICPLPPPPSPWHWRSCTCTPIPLPSPAASSCPIHPLAWTALWHQKGGNPPVNVTQAAAVVTVAAAAVAAMAVAVAAVAATAVAAAAVCGGYSCGGGYGCSGSCGGSSASWWTVSPQRQSRGRGSTAGTRRHSSHQGREGGGGGGGERIPSWGTRACVRGGPAWW